MRHLRGFSGFPGGSDGKESACNTGDPGSIPGWVWSPGEGNGLTTPVFLPGESHGQSLQSMGLQRIRAERLTLSGFLISLSSSRSWAMLVYFTGVVCEGI